MSISIPVSYGDFFDRLTILEIKGERIKDPDKLEIVNEALAEFRAIAFVSVPRLAEISDQVGELKDINNTLWDGENRIRELEKNGDYSAEFVETARSICRLKDRRAEIKCKIDKVLGSDVTEVKDYKAS
ncbi:DUF6165 family protein [Roseibium sp. HPY-6]|uniref:DUF6165 family protein n=1 Tax=Roseibium sp. HPY-6 TaxID=3229852 RepID=UPI0033905F31